MVKTRMELHELTLKQQLDGLRKSSFSSVELTQEYLKRIKSNNHLDDNLYHSFISFQKIKLKVRQQLPHH